MKILYLSVSYIPSRSASSVHAMKMCAALTREGHDVELVTKHAPRRQEAPIDDVFSFYGVSDRFRITRLARPAVRGGGALYLLRVRNLIRQRRDVNLIYSRDLIGAWLAQGAGLPVIFEAHGLPSGPQVWLARRLQRGPDLERLVFISQALAELWRESKLLYASTEILIAHDAADPIDDHITDRDDAGGPLRAGYVGHLYPGRGVELIIDMAHELPEVDFHLVGGRPGEIEAWRAQRTPPNVRFHGFVPHREVPALYRGFDVLLMPYQRSVGVRSGRSDTARWMSPMKMFEYLSAGRAILSSDLPVLREVLQHERNALLLDPEDPGAWIGAFRRLQSDSTLRRSLGDRAQRDFLRHHTWSARAQRVVDGLPR